MKAFIKTFYQSLNSHQSKKSQLDATVCQVIAIKLIVTHILFNTAPLLQNTVDEKPQKEDYQTVQLLGLVLELLSFCVEHHTYHIKNFIFQKDLLKRILVLMKSTHTFLVLGALRLLRKIIALKDEFYNR